MYINLLKSKIHRAIVTDCNLHYEGSLGIDKALMAKVGINDYEKILVVNLNNGERLETYAIPLEENCGKILLNGAAARKGTVGNEIIVMAFAWLKEEEKEKFKPKIIILDSDNGITEFKESYY